MELNPTRVVLVMLTPKQQAVANRVKAWEELSEMPPKEFA